MAIYITLCWVAAVGWAKRSVPPRSLDSPMEAPVNGLACRYYRQHHVGHEHGSEAAPRYATLRPGLARNDYQDPGWYKQPKGTVAFEFNVDVNKP